MQIKTKIKNTSFLQILNNDTLSVHAIHPNSSNS